MASSRITGTNEHISTYAASGADYTALSVWEAVYDIDLVTATTSEVLECAAGDYADRIAMAGATTSSSYFRLIRAASGAAHNGIPGTGVRFTGTVVTGTIVISESNAVIQDVMTTCTGNSASAAWGIQVSETAARIIGCIATATNAGSGTGLGMGTSGTPTGTVFVNSLAYGCKTTGIIMASGGTAYAYNCTSIGNTNGIIETSSGDFIVKNCLAADNSTTDFSGLHVSSNYNASSDASAPGANSRTEQTFTFVDADNDNWHLAINDAGAKNKGTDMREDSAFAYNDDIDFESLGSTWSIGFDGFPSVLGGGDLLLLGVGR